MRDGKTQERGFEPGSLAPGSVLSATVLGCVSQLALSRSVKIGLERIKEGKWPGRGLRWAGGAGVRMEPWQVPRDCATRRKEGLAGLGLSVCKMGSRTPASMVERAGMNVLCALKLFCQHSLTLPPHPRPCLLLHACLWSPLSPS